MRAEESNGFFPSLGISDRGFWIAQELSQLKRDNRLLLEQMTHLGELMGDLKVEVSSKLDKDDYYRHMDKIHPRTRGRVRDNRALIEALRILGTSLAAAVSALTGMKLLD